MINIDGCDRSRDIDPRPAGRIAYLMIVDSDPVAHVGITHMLSGNSSLAIGACARTWREALAAARVTNPDLALAGLRPPERAVRQLRRREYDILRRVATGETNAETAQVLGLATNTVKTYFQRTLEKLGARNRVEAVTYARKIGLP